MLRVSRSGYYAWLNRSESSRELYNRLILDEMKNIHRETRQTYGSPRMTIVLNGRGFKCGVNKVARLMSFNCIRAKMERKYKPRQWRDVSSIRKPNLLKQLAGKIEPNQVWVADYTYAKINGVYVFFSAVMDLYTRKLIGCEISKNRKYDLVTKALDQAIKAQKGLTPEIFHSDRGIEYANHSLGNKLKELGIKQSMSAKGNCYDNAYMESFFHTYKSEYYHHEIFESFDAFKKGTIKYISFYNKKRLHSSLNYNTPDEYELMVA